MAALNVLTQGRYIEVDERREYHLYLAEFGLDSLAPEVITNVIH